MNDKTPWTKRQKVVIVLTIITFLVLIWEIYSIVRGDLSPTPTATSTSINTQPTAPAAVTPPPGSTANNTSTTTATTTGSPTTIQPTTPDSTQPQEAELPEQAIESRSGLELNQQQYMQISNQYQLAKMQRQLLEEQVGIATARHSIADTEQQTSKILGSSDDSSLLSVGQTQPWHLTFIGLNNGRWHATLEQNGNYYDATENSKLPDGSQVMHIDKDGVQLHYQDQDWMVTFSGMTPIIKKPDETLPFDQSSAPINNLPAAPAIGPASPQQQAAPAVPLSALPNFNDNNSNDTDNTAAPTASTPVPQTNAPTSSETQNPPAATTPSQ